LSIAVADKEIQDSGSRDHCTDQVSECKEVFVLDLQKPLVVANVDRNKLQMVAAKVKEHAAKLRAQTATLVRDPAFKVTAVSAAGGAVTVGTAGGDAGCVTGGVLGAAVGLVTALFTFGLSIPIAATIGGGVGLFIGATAGGAVGAAGGGTAGYHIHRHRSANQGKKVAGA